MITTGPRDGPREGREEVIERPSNNHVVIESHDVRHPTGGKSYTYFGGNACNWIKALDIVSCLTNQGRMYIAFILSFYLCLQLQS